MTIRSRLLLLLLPPLAIFLILISLFFYFNWSREILNGFQSRLQLIVTAASKTISEQEVEWLTQHIHDPKILSDPTYLNYRKQLTSLKQHLPITNIYIFQIVPLEDLNKVLTKQENIRSKENDASFRTSLNQLMLLDIKENNDEAAIQSSEYTFREADLQSIFKSKKAFVSPIYESRNTNERFISAYAPILNSQSEVIAILGADVSMNEIDQKLDNAWLIILLGSWVTLLLVLSTVYLIAERISKPVRQLNQAALEIAAGDYETDIKVEGPKEIAELANTLNTMSECLVENISRLRESSIIRERLYGEYECALLLQHYMLQKVIDEFEHPHLRMKLISIPLLPLQKGMLLKIDHSSGIDLSLTLLEAQEQGFPGLFHLNQWTNLPKTKLKNKIFVECQFLDQFKILRYHSHSLFPPLVWSVKTQQFIKGDHQEISLQNADMIFLYNSSLIEQFDTEKALENWFARVLRHFAEDGLETIHTMLTNELTFLAKKLEVKRNFKIIVIQLTTNAT